MTIRSIELGDIEKCIRLSQIKWFIASDYDSAMAGDGCKVGEKVFLLETAEIRSESAGWPCITSNEFENELVEFGLSKRSAWPRVDCRVWCWICCADSRTRQATQSFSLRHRFKAFIGFESKHSVVPSRLDSFKAVNRSPCAIAPIVNSHNIGAHAKATWSAARSPQ